MNVAELNVASQSPVGSLVLVLGGCLSTLYSTM